MLEDIFNNKKEQPIIISAVLTNYSYALVTFPERKHLVHA